MLEAVLTPLLVVALAARSGAGAPLPEIAARTPEDRREAAQRRGELASLQALLEGERGREVPYGTGNRQVIGAKGHRLLLFVRTWHGSVERVASFDTELSWVTLYALVLDAQRRPRLLLIEPRGSPYAYELDHYVFDQDGHTVARDHSYGTAVDLRRRSPARAPHRDHLPPHAPRVVARDVTLLDERGSLAEGCALEQGGPPLPDAATILRDHGLAPVARAAGARVGAVTAR